MRGSFLKRIQRNYCILVVLPFLLFLVFIGSISNVKSGYPENSIQCKDGICEGADGRGHHSRDTNQNSNFHINGNKPRDKRKADEHAGSRQTIKPKPPPRNLAEIMIWITPKLPAGRQKRLEEIRDTMNSQSCFDGCRLTVSRNQKLADYADALIFFMFTIGYKREELPTRHSWNQIWVYNQHEPPPNYSPKSHLNGLFNWTMTYRRDSDMYQPYYYKFPLGSPKASITFGNGITLQNWIKGKSSLGTAVISRCKSESKREVILRNLQSAGISIDIYGGCGNKTLCPRLADNCDDFWLEHASKYKFFFAFENSLCSDYITEKFWRSLELGMVPVVLGRGKYLEVAPPKSFIDLRDFSTPQELKRYLKLLDDDPMEYAKYFEWRKHYSIHYNTDDFCEICGKLREHKRIVKEAATSHSPSWLQGYSKAYKDIVGWWGYAPGHGRKPVCITPKEMGLGNFLK